MTRQANDLTGQRFGRLYVIHRAKKISERPGAEWVCKCDCGTIKTILGRDLVGEEVRSCGCLRSDMLRARARDMVKKSRGSSGLISADFDRPD